MLTLVLIAIFLAILLILLLADDERRNWYFGLRGPWGLPVVGYLPFLSQFPPRKLAELSKTYGDVFWYILY